MTTRSNGGHGEVMLKLMRTYDLLAVNTLFKPAENDGGQNAENTSAKRRTYKR